MTTVLSQKGQIVLPAGIRKQLDLQPGDDFEILVDDDDDGTIVLKRVQSPPNAGLIDHLLSAPGGLDIPDRAKDAPEAIAFDD